MCPPWDKPRRYRARVKFVLASLAIALALVAALLWPALAAARRNAQSLTAGTQLRALAQALANHAADNRNRFPKRGDDVASILADGTLSPELQAWLAEAATGDPPRVLYCPPPGGMPRSNAVLLLEHPAHHPEGVNVAYADMHVEFVPREGLPALIASIGEAQSLGGKPVMLETQVVRRPARIDSLA